MKKKKKRLVAVGKNEKTGTHLMAKLCAVQALPLNYVQFSHEQYKRINLKIKNKKLTIALIKHKVTKDPQ